MSLSSALLVTLFFFFSKTQTEDRLSKMQSSQRTTNMNTIYSLVIKRTAELAPLIDVCPPVPLCFSDRSSLLFLSSVIHSNLILLSPGVLQEVAQNTLQGHPDYLSLSNSNASIRRTLALINKACEQASTRAQLLTIAPRITGSPLKLWFFYLNFHLLSWISNVSNISLS